jgi:hypothetical protein
LLRTGRAKHIRAEHIIGLAMGQFGHQIGAAGRHHDGVGRTAEVDVRHVIGFAGIPLRHHYRVIGQSLQGDGSYELRSSLGHHHLHAGALLNQATA